MQTELVIACVKWGRRFHSCYANILYDMVKRNLPESCNFTFTCFTDNPEGLDKNIIARELPANLNGWWNKLYLFKPGVFKPNQRVVYFDLDTIITGPLDEIANYRGELALLRDFYRLKGLGSGVMLWQGGSNSHIWVSYEMANMPELEGGDQAWIEIAQPNARILQDIFPDSFASYKTDCKPLPPLGTKVVCFHGEPKQDNCGSAWVKDIWRINGAKSVEPDKAYPAQAEILSANVKANIKLPNRWLTGVPAHDAAAVIVGGGPSLRESFNELLAFKKPGCKLFALNSSIKWLEEAGINADSHIIFNSEETFTTEYEGEKYYASTLPPELFNDDKIILWHPYGNNISQLLGDDPRARELVMGGSTTGLKSIHIAYLLGYRKFHLFGFDSCCTEHGQHHAYPLPESDKYRLFETEVFGHKFLTAEWMLSQAKDFVTAANDLIKNGCQVSIYGNSLLSAMANEIARLNPAT